jgi:hypothetical protein
MPLAESTATDCLYSRHVNPQWVKLLNVLELAVSYEPSRSARLPSLPDTSAAGRKDVRGCSFHREGPQPAIESKRDLQFR